MSRSIEIEMYLVHETAMVNDEVDLDRVCRVLSKLEVEGRNNLKTFLTF